MNRTACIRDYRSAFMANARNHFLSHALLDAIEDEDMSTIEFLLIEKQANPNLVVGRFGIAPIHCSIGVGTEDFALNIVELCLKHGGNPNERGSEGLTPVMIATIWARAKILKLLLSYGGDPLLIDDEGKSAVDFAKNLSICNILKFYLLQLASQPDTFGTADTAVMEVICSEESKPASNSPDIDECTNEHDKSNSINSTYILPESNKYAEEMLQEYSVMENCFSDVDCNISGIEIFPRPKDGSSPQEFLLLSDDSANCSVGKTMLINSIITDGSLSESISNSYLNNAFSGQLSDFNDATVQSSCNSSQRNEIFESEVDLKSVEDSSQPSSSLSSCATDTLKELLKSNNVSHGPILKSTKAVYLKYLKKRQEEMMNTETVFSNGANDVLTSTLKCRLYGFISRWSHLEKNMLDDLKMLDNLNKNESSYDKSFFTYLLIDPNELGDWTSCGLMDNDSRDELWVKFLQSVFYVGKGKNNRPLSHLIEAYKFLNIGHHNLKIKKVLNIWESGSGVISLHVFQNTTNKEAHTREAAMIDALRGANLTNMQSGEYHGTTRSWSLKRKMQLGVVLLYKAFRVLLIEGIREIFPGDLVVRERRKI